MRSAAQRQTRQACQRDRHGEYLEGGAALHGVVSWQRQNQSSTIAVLALR
jgi:hypothetical protein